MAATDNQIHAVWQNIERLGMEKTLRFKEEAATHQDWLRNIVPELKQQLNQPCALSIGLPKTPSTRVRKGRKRKAFEDEKVDEENPKSLVSRPARKPTRKPLAQKQPTVSSTTLKTKKVKTTLKLKERPSVRTPNTGSGKSKRTRAKVIGTTKVTTATTKKRNETAGNTKPSVKLTRSKSVKEVRNEVPTVEIVGTEQLDSLPISTDAAIGNTLDPITNIVPNESSLNSSTNQEDPIDTSSTPLVAETIAAIEALAPKSKRTAKKRTKNATQHDDPVKKTRVTRQRAARNKATTKPQTTRSLRARPIAQVTKDLDESKNKEAEQEINAEDTESNYPIEDELDSSSVKESTKDVEGAPDYRYKDAGSMVDNEEEKSEEEEEQELLLKDNDERDMPSPEDNDSDAPIEVIPETDANNDTEVTPSNNDQGDKGESTSFTRRESVSDVASQNSHPLDTSAQSPMLFVTDADRSSGKKPTRGSRLSSSTRHEAKTPMLDFSSPDYVTGDKDDIDSDNQSLGNPATPEEQSQLENVQKKQTKQADESTTDTTDEDADDEGQDEEEDDEKINKELEAISPQPSNASDRPTTPNTPKDNPFKSPPSNRKDPTQNDSFLSPVLRCERPPQSVTPRSNSRQKRVNQSGYRSPLSKSTFNSPLNLSIGSPRLRFCDKSAFSGDHRPIAEESMMNISSDCSPRAVRKFQAPISATQTPNSNTPSKIPVPLNTPTTTPAPVPSATVTKPVAQQKRTLGMKRLQGARTPSSTNTFLPRTPVLRSPLAKTPANTPQGADGNNVAVPGTVILSRARPIQQRQDNALGSPALHSPQIPSNLGKAQSSNLTSVPSTHTASPKPRTPKGKKVKVNAIQAAKMARRKEEQRKRDREAMLQRKREELEQAKKEQKLKQEADRIAIAKAAKERTLKGPDVKRSTTAKPRPAVQTVKKTIKRLQTEKPGTNGKVSRQKTATSILSATQRQEEIRRKNKERQMKVEENKMKMKALQEAKQQLQLKKMKEDEERIALERAKKEEHDRMMKEKLERRHKEAEIRRAEEMKRRELEAQQEAERVAAEEPFEHGEDGDEEAEEKYYFSSGDEEQMNAMDKEDEEDEEGYSDVIHPYQSKHDYDNYDISNTNPDESSDDEDHPKCRVPAWAQGDALRRAIMKQFMVEDADPGNLFHAVSPPKLTEIFPTSTKDFGKRTSSALWDYSPTRPGVVKKVM